MMIVSFKSRPTWERSYSTINIEDASRVASRTITNLNIVALVVIATFPE